MAVLRLADPDSDHGPSVVWFSLLRSLLKSDGGDPFEMGAQGRFAASS